MFPAWVLSRSLVKGILLKKKNQIFGMEEFEETKSSQRM